MLVSSFVLERIVIFHSFLVFPAISLFYVPGVCKLSLAWSFKAYDLAFGRASAGKNQAANGKKKEETIFH
jgi:hypothetical protein